LEEGTVLAFLGGSLPLDARASAERHMADCETCADLVTWVAADQAHSTARMPGNTARPFIGQLPPGSRVGRYQILGALGRGGMGEVYAAYHPDLDRRIALKVVLGMDGTTGDRRNRLLREARAIARLSHPNVVTVHDAGSFGDRVFIAMELIDGRTIDEWLRAEPRRWQEVLEVFVAAGRGLAAAHAAGVVHRDFKPQNVMIAKSGAVRVMDFGLARLAEDDAGERREAGEDQPTLAIKFTTKTGAIVGTPAYMSPEQFRREPADARSDQFSFCVALHEALFGTRPEAALAQADQPGPDAKASHAGVPTWLRAIVLRGASGEREARHRSMDVLIASLERGRKRLRRRISVAAVGLAALVLTAGAWRLAHGNRFLCAVPGERIAAAWDDADGSNQRRQSIHRAFAATGRPTAEASWERLSRVLDNYVNSWKAMYLQTCEATHVRGEQSAEALDLRMSCLNDNLDQVRALTDELMAADGGALSHAVAASQELTPVSRCADVSLLKSRVPLPKDERTLRAVEAIRPAMRDLQVLWDIGNGPELLKRAVALRPGVEATGYKPLLAELLELIGAAQVFEDADLSEAEATLREAIVVADASRDDIDAAKAASELGYVFGYRLGRPKEGEFFLQLAESFLDRNGPGNEQIRAWILTDRVANRCRQGTFDGTQALSEEAIRLKQQAVGPDHPDVAIGFTSLAVTLLSSNQPEAALEAANRAIDIFVKYGDPEAFQFAIALANQGEALNVLERYQEAEGACQSSIRIFQSQQSNPPQPESAYAFRGLGEAMIGQGQPRAAIGPLQKTLQLCGPARCDPILVADTNFALAKALWDTGTDRRRARSLALAALTAYEGARRTARRDAVEQWLGAHRQRSLPYGQLHFISSKY
jgi:tetratricopeptide (TPR) repeat protein/predicted Ser/Thr protein kinase